jgi:hypothetical protein
MIFFGLQPTVRMRSTFRLVIACFLLYFPISFYLANFNSWEILRTDSLHNETSLAFIDSASLATTGKVFKMERVKRYTGHNTFPKDTFPKGPFAMNSYPTGDKWAVVTTIFQPTKTVKTLSQMKGWCTVIVADAKSLDSERYMAELDAEQDSCLVYLSLKAQATLGYSILDHIPTNSFGRKNVGFIFAIQHGAQVIYDTDDDNEISDQMLMELWSMRDWSSGHNALFEWMKGGSNPYPAFGADHVWPRGLPLDQVKDQASYKWTLATSVINKTDICVVQSLANEEPDVDAIYRLTNPNYPLLFGSKQTACQIDAGWMAPFNAQATLFFKEAFPFLLLPVTVHGRVSDIWRSYMAQALMKCSLVFSTPWVTQIRNSHNYLADFQAELPLYIQSTALVAHLMNQSKYLSLSGAMVDAYEYGVVENLDLALAFAWESDLERAALSLFPPRNSSKSFKHLFIGMGRGADLRHWKNQILNDQGLSHIDLLLGVFDEPAEALMCGEQDRVQCVSSQGTSWTTGRNALAKAAYQREVNRKEKYTYWTFADADIRLVCLVDGQNDLQISDRCFANFDHFLYQTMMPVIGTISNGQFEVRNGSLMLGLEAFDAAFNSFHRDAIQVLLPYNSDQDSVTWWSSQAIFWFRVRCFSPLYAVAPLDIFYRNPEHGAYPRNKRDRTAELGIGQKMLGRLASVLNGAPDDYLAQLTADKVMLVREMTGVDWRKKTHSFQLCVREFTEFHDFVKPEKLASDLERL